MTNRVVISGLGVCSQFGADTSDFWKAIVDGKNAVREWSPEGVSDFPVQYAAAIDTPLDELVATYLADWPLAQHTERRTVFGLVSAQQAIQDAKLDDLEQASIGVAVCSGVPGFDDESLLQVAGSESTSAFIHAGRSLSRFSGLPTSNDDLASVIVNRLQTSAATVNVSGACAGATQAIGLGYQAIRRGEASIMLCGGADSVLNLRTLAALQLLGATATSTRFGDALCRPFDKDRCGLVAGEGGAMLVLEDEAHAKARGATIYAEVLGYGTSLDAYKVTAPHPEGIGAELAIRRAIDDAHIPAEHIRYVNAHGTSTELNDKIETNAIRRIFGNHADDMLVSSTKSSIGHWIAAAGAPEALVTALALKHQCIPPTINLTEPAEGLDLDYVMHSARLTELSYAISNSFGFGGINASLVLGSYDE